MIYTIYHVHFRFMVLPFLYLKNSKMHTTILQGCIGKRNLVVRKRNLNRYIMILLLHQAKR